MLCLGHWKGSIHVPLFIALWLYRQISVSTAFVARHPPTKTPASSIIISRSPSALYAENKRDEKDLTGLLNELNQNFDYEGRMESKTIGKDFRCGFVVIIGVREKISACQQLQQIDILPAELTPSQPL
eukprot:scaffold3763_cov165-Amphora_coffeaeformis.AAC.17